MRADIGSSSLPTLHPISWQHQNAVCVCNIPCSTPGLDYDPALSKQWDEAKSPQLMWPEIVRTIEAGGGYLTCATDDGETLQAFESRAEAIAAHIVQI